MKKISIDEIDFALDYEGYIWYSNESKPHIISKINREDFKELPFIVEGNLYSDSKKISISIKYIDGNYKIFRVSLLGLPEDQITSNEYLSHKLDGIKKIKMIQYWEESEPDELLENMKTLQPSWQAFTGFIKNN